MPYLPISTVRPVQPDKEILERSQFKKEMEDDERIEKLKAVPDSIEMIIQLLFHFLGLNKTKLIFDSQIFDYSSVSYTKITMIIWIQ